MATKRQNILAKIQAVLDNTDCINYTEVDRMIQPDLETVPLPCAFIYPGTETRITPTGGTIGQENWEWAIVIEVWANDKKNPLEEVLRLIHATMYDNYKLGDYAEYSFRTGVEMFYVDPEKEIKGMNINYLVRYSHPKGVM